MFRQNFVRRAGLAIGQNGKRRVDNRARGSDDLHTLVFGRMCCLLCRFRNGIRTLRTCGKGVSHIYGHSRLAVRLLVPYNRCRG